MKIATWNVNGIRAREAQLCEWMERDRPDVLCLQELKAEPAQIPERCKVADYHAYWHGVRGYSGVSLHIRKDLFDAQPHPLAASMAECLADSRRFASFVTANDNKVRKKLRTMQDPEALRERSLGAAYEPQPSTSTS
jgi:exodeoxyribonuclease-3